VDLDVRNEPVVRQSLGHPCLDAKRALNGGLASHFLGAWKPPNAVQIDHGGHVLMISRPPHVLFDSFPQEVEGHATEAAGCQRFRSWEDPKRAEMGGKDLRHESLLSLPFAEDA
jgi:hypothetical protein